MGIGETGGFGTDTDQFRAEQQGGRRGVVDFSKVPGLGGQVRREHLETVIFQTADGAGYIGMDHDRHPFARSGGSQVMTRQLRRIRHDMGPENAHRVATANNCRQVMRLVHILRQYRQIRLAACQYAV